MESSYLPELAKLYEELRWLDPFDELPCFLYLMGYRGNLEDGSPLAAMIADALGAEVKIGWLSFSVDGKVYAIPPHWQRFEQLFFDEIFPELQS